jgi:hypothetical protein
MLSLLLLLLAFIIVNSTTSISPISRQNNFLDCFRNEKRGPPQFNCLNRFLQARSPQILTPKEHVFHMPISLNYGSTSRPPGKYLRHSSKKFFTIFLEFLQPPFQHIFSNETTNNDNNNNNIYIICYYNNGGTQTTINYNTSTYNDNKEADKDTANSIHRTDKIKWFDISNNNTIDITSDNNNNYITTTARKSISNNNSNKDSDSYYSTNTTTTTTTTTTTIDYNTSTNDKDDEENTSNNNYSMVPLPSNDNNNNNNNNNNSSNNNNELTDATDTTHTCLLAPLTTRTRTRRMKIEEANDDRRIPSYTINPSKFATWKPISNNNNKDSDSYYYYYYYYLYSGH